MKPDPKMRTYMSNRSPMFRFVHHACLAAMLAALLPIVGCTKTAEVTPAPAPPPTFSGPDFLRTTIASVATLDGYQPVLVSGYGLVVNLDGTGSPDCPPALRALMLDELGKRGFGRHSTGYEHLSPVQVLASDRTAVVRVDGIIPPGASEGDRFDLLISTLPNTSTTSLEGGTLYTMDLAIGGANLTPSAVTPIARGRGAVFVNPFLIKKGDTPPEDHKMGRILGGGVITAPPVIELITNEPSYRLTRQIADRINGRFPQSPDDPYPLAVPKSDTRIALNLLKTFEDNPQRMLDLVSHLYLNPTVGFNREKAAELMKLVQTPGNAIYANDMAYTWEAMGPYVQPVIEELYDNADPGIRVAALQAGAHLQDTKAIDPLIALASAGEGQVSERATKLLGVLLKRNPANPKMVGAMRQLLDSDDTLVRLAAYECLAGVDDPSIRRFAFDDKLELAQVQCQKPMVYVARTGRPRVIVFNDSIGFNKPLMVSMWNDKLMLRATENSNLVDVFMKKAGGKSMTEKIPDNVPYLAGVMAFHPTDDSKTPGFDLTYSEIVTVLYRLTSQRHIDAPLVLEGSDLEARIATMKTAEMFEAARPDTEAGATRPDSEGGAARPDAAPKEEKKSKGFFNFFGGSDDKKTDK
ncbi:MAG: hypothetical protein GC159_05705 [Phycisphaera sp.]|nr:hypothetical protein [Phycisphaera sp.]